MVATATAVQRYQVQVARRGKQPTNRWRPPLPLPLQPRPTGQRRRPRRLHMHTGTRGRRRRGALAWRCPCLLRRRPHTMAQVHITAAVTVTPRCTTRRCAGCGRCPHSVPPAHLTVPARTTWCRGVGVAAAAATASGSVRVAPTPAAPPPPPPQPLAPPLVVPLTPLPLGPWHCGRRNCGGRHTGRRTTSGGRVMTRTAGASAA